jgi:hypothetical protein
MKLSYAVAWSSNGTAGAGRLEPFADRFELFGRGPRISIRFADLVGVSIGRGRAERLLGLPVLALSLRNGGAIRIASLEGVGLLHELAGRIERAGRPVAAA